MKQLILGGLLVIGTASAMEQGQAREAEKNIKKLLSLQRELFDLERQNNLLDADAVRGWLYLTNKKKKKDAKIALAPQKIDLLRREDICREELEAVEHKLAADKVKIATSGTKFAIELDIDVKSLVSNGKERTRKAKKK